MYKPKTYLHIKPNDNILIPSTHLCFSSTNSVFGSTQGTGVEHAVLARLIDSLCRSNCRMTLDSFSCKVSRSSSNYNKSNIIHSLYPDKLKNIYQDQYLLEIYRIIPWLLQVSAPQPAIAVRQLIGRLHLVVSEVQQETCNHHSFHSHLQHLK